MSQSLSTYSFLPWLRQGIANKIEASDFDPSVKLRATIQVQLQLSGEGGGSNLIQNITREVQLFGPGDIIGIENRAIFKTEPYYQIWITNFEPNYLPYVDFYDEDFPWRYTPTAPDAASKRLRPWIMLVVLQEGEFEEGTNLKNKPLPFIKVTDTGVFPPAEQLWAWAHVHVNRSLTPGENDIVSSDMKSVLPKLQATLSENPDLAYSRILCPRKLEENAAYHAFLIPVFESGRLAGIGLSQDQTPSASFSAWATYTNKQEPQHFPYYFRWYFRTGAVGDFEYLVRLLQPKPVDKRVGTRDMDVQHPDANLHGINDPELGGVLKLGGALHVPLQSLESEDRAEVKKYDRWAQPYPHPFQDELAAFINLSDDYATQAAQDANDKSGFGKVVQTDGSVQFDPDPLITPPLYGRWHALTQRLLEDRAGNALSPNDNWVHELNLDPRYRVVAGFGTSVVQKQQEEYMNAAWEQVGDILKANDRIRKAQLAKEVSWVWYNRHLQPLFSVNMEKALMLSAPVQSRVLLQDFTVYHHVKTSLLPSAVISVPMRRILRPGGRFARLLPFHDSIQPGNLLNRINEGEVSPAPPKQTPPGVVTLKDISSILMPKNAPSFLLNWLKRFPWLEYIALLLALVIVLLLILFGPTGVWMTIGGGVTAGLLYLFLRLRRLAAQVRQAESLLEENQTVEAVDRLPRSPDFVISEPQAGFTATRGTTDSSEAVRFKTALKDLDLLLGASTAAAQQPPRLKLNLPAVTAATVQAINPEVTIPRRTWQAIQIPARLRSGLDEELNEVMAYPQIDAPMYKPLIEISSELFLPNINLIEQNSITLLETNQKFVEAYLMGLNHEFARELLWREYPTDQRGSYFRQFWDVGGYFNSENLSNDDLKEKLRDIPPLDRWPSSSKLGDHDNRALSGSKAAEAVLVIRGELLKKYPRAVIYAHRAEWQRKSNGQIDQTKERVLVALSDKENPPKHKARTPLYDAKVEPDINFFGFDLTVTEARGGTGAHETDDPGWFFVIKERPGEPRFGLDIKRDGTLNVWDDLSWEDVLPGTKAGAFMQITSTTSSIVLTQPTQTEVQEKLPQYEDDKFVAWDKDASSADLAYILYQAPVLVAIHAAELLPKA